MFELFRRMAYERVQVFDPDEVTTVAEGEDPTASGLPPHVADDIWEAVKDWYGVGLQPAMQLCVRHRGEVIVDRAIGHARGNEPGGSEEPLVRATPDTLFDLFSASKVVVAMLVHMLDDEGRLHLDDPVEMFLPTFGRHGKHFITIRHVLSHRAGIPVVPGDEVDLDLINDADEIVRRICDTRASSRAGRRLAYHALTGGWILAAILEQITGQDLPTLVRERISEPLGLEHFRYGVEPERLGDVAKDVFTGPPPAQPYAFLLERSLGTDIRTACRIASDPRWLTAVVPSGNIISTARQTTVFFDCLRQGGLWKGRRVFRRRTVRRAVSEQSYRELDAVMMLPVRYGLGFMLGGDRLSFYGPDTPKAFGHLGFTNVLAWADPERNLSVSFMSSGKPFVTPDLVWWQRVMYRISQSVPRYRIPGPALPLGAYDDG